MVHTTKEDYAMGNMITFLCSFMGSCAGVILVGIAIIREQKKAAKAKMAEAEATFQKVFGQPQTGERED